MKRCQKAHSFTLTELMVALSIVFIVATGAGIKIHQAVQEKRFNATVTKLKSKFETSYKLARLSQESIDITFEKKDVPDRSEQVVFVTLHLPTTISGMIAKCISKPEPLEHISHILYRGKDLFSKRPNKRTIHIYPSGMLRPDSELILFQNEQETVGSKIDLSSFTLTPDEKDLQKMNKELFPYDVLTQEKE